MRSCSHARSQGGSRSALGKRDNDFFRTNFSVPPRSHPCSHQHAHASKGVYSSTLPASQTSERAARGGGSQVHSRFIHVPGSLSLSCPCRIQCMCIACASNSYRTVHVHVGHVGSHVHHVHVHVHIHVLGRTCVRACACACVCSCSCSVHVKSCACACCACREGALPRSAGPRGRSTCLKVTSPSPRRPRARRSERAWRRRASLGCTRGRR